MTILLWILEEGEGGVGGSAGGQEAFYIFTGRTLWFCMKG